MNPNAQQRFRDLRDELNAAVDRHQSLRRFDSALHQSLVIGAALAGFASLWVGIYEGRRA